jgi:hypothetical protein
LKIWMSGMRLLLHGAPDDEREPRRTMARPALTRHRSA